MKTLITQISSIASKIALFAIGCGVAGLGFALVGVLTLFGVAAFGLAFMAALFVPTDHANDARPDARA